MKREDIISFQCEGSPKNTLLCRFRDNYPTCHTAFFAVYRGFSGFSFQCAKIHNYLYIAKYFLKI